MLPRNTKLAALTADDYLLAAVEFIDREFGEGYAKAHPELVGDFMKTQALDSGATVIARALQNWRNDCGC